MVLEINMQSKENGSAPIVNESDASHNNNSASVINGETKKVPPPKPPKRVSFLYNHKDSPVNKSDKSDSDGRKIEVNDKSFIPKSVLKKPSKSAFNCDNTLKSSDSQSSDVRTVKTDKDKVNDTEKVTATRSNSVKQLKSEFVKANGGIANNNNQIPFNKKPVINESTTDPQSRLSESQSKIAKLQQSLPTKLSDATVQSLKNKYSPSSFGYPKNFIAESKSVTITSRIPLITKPTTPKNKTETDKLAQDTAEVANFNNNISFKVDGVSPGQIKIQEKKIFKSELYITPEIDIDKSSPVSTTENKTLSDVGDKSDVQKEDETFLDRLVTKKSKVKFLIEEKFNKDVINDTNPDVKRIRPKPKLETRAHTEDKRNEEDPTEPTGKTDINENNLEAPETQDISLDTPNNVPEESTTIVVVQAKLIHAEEFPKTEKVIIEDDDSDTLTLTSEDSGNSQDTVPSVIESKVEEKSSSELTLTEISVDMEEASNKKPTKKRSNSFRKIFSFGSGKDKEKKKDEVKSKNGIKTKGAHADNMENETSAFDRNAPQRHTFSGYTKSNHDNIKPGHYNCRPMHGKYHEYQNSPIYSNQPHTEVNRLNTSLPVSMRYHFSSPQERMHERDRLNMNTIQYDLYLAQQNSKRLNNSGNVPVNASRVDEYVCMDNIDKQNRNDLTQPGFINSHAVNKYIDTTSSSSSCTLESDVQNNMYENALTRKLSNDRSSEDNSSVCNSRIPLPRTLSTEKRPFLPNGDKLYERPKYTNSPEIFTTTPRRIQDPQLIKPKAIIPINTERSLPNPYRNNQDGQSQSVNDNVYGNINKQQADCNVNIPRSPGKENLYGKPVPAVRKNINSDMNYGNISRMNRDAEEDLYGTVYDSLSPVSAQLKITKTNVIKTQNKNVEKLRSRSISPAQRQRSTVVSPTPPNNKSNDSPAKKEIEPTKLKLSPNRERYEPRLKSPFDENLTSPPVSRKEPKRKNEETTHQNLEEAIDYPDNNINEGLNKKETAEKSMFPIEDINKRSSDPDSPKRLVNLSRSPHVSPVRPKSLQSAPKILENVTRDTVDTTRIASIRSPVTIRTESPVSVASSYSIQSSPRSKLLVSSEDLKDLKSTEVYFWEQMSKLSNTSIEKVGDKKENSPDSSPQQVLTQVVVHQQPPASPRKQQSPSPTKPVSPQKQQNMKNLEAFYWQEIKKLKEKEEHEIYNQQLQLLGRHNSVNLPQEAMQHRSRSMSPAVNRVRDKRSFSLPREMQPQKMNEYYGYTKQQVILEENMQGKPAQYGMVRQQFSPNPNFVRGSPQRSTIGPSVPSKQLATDLIYENYFPGVELRHQARSVQCAPIFKRGSLVTSSSRENSPQNNKKVSFSSARSDESQAWPTKNGFTQSPPTRRVEKKSESLEDDVFYEGFQNNSAAAENERNSQQQQNSAAQESPYGTQQYITKNEILAQRMKIQDPRFASAEQVYKANAQNFQNAQQMQVPTAVRNIRSQSVEPIYISGKPPQYPNQEPIYVSKTPNEQIYGRTKQITINNKVCDFYGQIHEAPPSIYGNIQKSGVIYGQLQQNPVPGSPMSLRSQCLNKSNPAFVRGTRLTASFNDMRHDAPRRPLPPLPRDKIILHGRGVVPIVSESESGSEAGEVQRILERREMNRRQIGE